MTLRLTDGTDYELQVCKQEYDPEVDTQLLICVLTADYDFDSVTETLKKYEIAEILSIYEDGITVFQSHDYKNVYSVTKDIRSKIITITFSSKKRD